ncbi:hypothetical protein F2Q69_00006588 [Brassica cretica]|uniref:Uncharacterized protein n=1 Tax=Brassica cretica TaxID=69181 RepID=A0A8S9P204_BRACR|nr:hypothetical protein F2Q69_00006588 [Brassica cretica]
MLHYADDLSSHAGLPSHHVQVSRSQPCLTAQYRSMFGPKYRSTSDGRCRSTEEECLRSMVVSEYRSMVVSEYQSTRLVPRSTMADENRATNKCFLVGSSTAGHVPEKPRKYFV